jgi:hypothetical protein
MEINGKRYSSVLEMVKAISSPDFAAAFERNLKRRTVYVYIDKSLDFVQVFKKLKAAKRFAEGMDMGELKWECTKDKKGEDLWTLGDITIRQCQIVFC